MLLYHTTDRSACDAIADEGFSNGDRGVVHLAEDVWSWSQNWMQPIEAITDVGTNEVVFVFDVPDAIAAECAKDACQLSPTDEDYDPEMDNFEGLLAPDEIIWREYHIPAETANRYFVGLAYWSGICPLSGEQIKKLWERRAESNRPSRIGPK